MQTLNEQITSCIEDFMDSVTGFVTDPENLQIELTFTAICFIMAFLTIIISKMIDRVTSPEYIEFEYEEDEGL